jgi:hypothetical protein
MMGGSISITSVASSGTFDPSLPTYRDHARLLLGDTDTTAVLLADSTIDAKLALFPYPEAVAQLALSLIALYGQKPDQYGEQGGVQVRWGERINAWRQIVDDARNGNIADPSLTEAIQVKSNNDDYKREFTLTHRSDSGDVVTTGDFEAW